MRRRCRNLAKRLEHNVPLFADLFQAAERVKRPGYFAGYVRRAIKSFY